MEVTRMWMHGGPAWEHMYGIGIFFQLLLVVGIVLVVSALVAYYLQTRKGAGNNDPYVDQLKGMYVRGELSEEEYFRKREVLRGNGQAFAKTATKEVPLPPATKEENHENIS